MPKTEQIHFLKLPSQQKLDLVLINKLFHELLTWKIIPTRNGDIKTEYVFVLKCFYGRKPAKFAVESLNFMFLCAALIAF